MITSNKPGEKTLGLYVHIPFCVQKCLYCDFLSFDKIDIPTQSAYISALCSEIEYIGRVYGNKFIVNSIFIGGGTPSLLPFEMIAQVISTIQSSFEISDFSEITMETNPRTLTAEKLGRYLDAGINRLSIGAQSFDETALRTLGRIHSASDVQKAFWIAREMGFDNINMDLMFGIPGQSLKAWQDTLEEAIALGPEHISFYSLQLEEGTPFFTLFESGALKLLPEELDRKMYHLAVDMLSCAGYEHYEISNAAKPGYACRHNIKYWSFEEYLGAGLGAHSFIEGVRFSGETELTSYISSPANRKSCWRHVNSEKDNMSEYIFTGLRKTEGIDLADFTRRFSRPIEEAYREIWPKILEQIENGCLAMDEGRLRLTIEGIDISNAIFCEFV